MWCGWLISFHPISRHVHLVLHDKRNAKPIFPTIKGRVFVTLGSSSPTSRAAANCVSNSPESKLKRNQFETWLEAPSGSVTRNEFNCGQPKRKSCPSYWKWGHAYRACSRAGGRMHWYLPCISLRLCLAISDSPWPKDSPWTLLINAVGVRISSNGLEKMRVHHLAWMGHALPDFAYSHRLKSFTTMLLPTSLRSLPLVIKAWAHCQHLEATVPQRQTY